MITIPIQQINALLSHSELIDRVRAGIIAYERGDYIIPDRLHLDGPYLTYLAMPAMGPKYTCCKLVSVVPANRDRGLPIVVGDLLLSDSQTGETLAIMDASSLTAMRTGAVGGLGLDLIAPKDVADIGVIGCGVQGLHQAMFSCAVREVKRIFCYNRSTERYVGFISALNERYPDVAISVCDDPDEVVDQAEVIYACTNAKAPVFSDDPSLIRGKYFISVGSFATDMQELPACVYQQADKVLIDTYNAKTEVGDIINAIKHNWKKEKDFISLGKAIEERDVQTSNCDHMVFKSVGMAAFDLAVAGAIYEKAISNSKMKES